GRVDPQLEARVALAAEAGVGVRPRHSRVSKAMGELRQSPRTCTARGYNSALRDELAPARTPDRGPDLGKRAACPAAEDSVDAPGPVARPARHDVEMHVGDRLPGRVAVVDADRRAGGDRQPSAPRSARVAAPGSGAARMARMTAAPAAPAARTAGTRSAVTPPIASTGIAAARTASWSRASPWAPAFEGVSHTGPKSAKSAPAAASPGACVETPTSAPAGSSRRATSTGTDPVPSCTPSA